MLLYLREKDWIEWRRDFSLNSFNEVIRGVIEQDKDKDKDKDREGKVRKELVEYLKSWLAFVEKKPIIAAMVFNQVFFTTGLPLDYHWVHGWIHS